MNMKSDLTCFLSELQQKACRGDYVFRGERDAMNDYELPVTSSLYRRVQANRRSPDHVVPGRLPPLQETETRLLAALQDRIADEINRLLPEPYAVSDRRNAAPAPAVSNGPTNLIDFTRDYLVALFFSCYDRKGEENGAGWTGGDGCIVLLPANDARIVAAPIGALWTIAQRSVFWEAESGVLPAGAYEILYVPVCLKRQLLMYLARCHDICTDTMFPDFLAAVRQVSSRASLEFLWDQVSIANGSG